MARVLSCVVINIARDTVILGSILNLKATWILNIVTLIDFESENGENVELLGELKKTKTKLQSPYLGWEETV